MLTKLITWPYAEFDNCEEFDLEFDLSDHLCGFDSLFKNQLLTKLQRYAESNDRHYQIVHNGILPDQVRDNYKNLELLFSADQQNKHILAHFLNYHIHPELTFKNFICSFNGTPHVGRKLLVSILQKFGYFDTKYCSKNFEYSVDILDGHLFDHVGDRINFYRKFFIADDGDRFFQMVNSFGHVQYQHNKNIYNLESKLTQSFLHIVSETLATSYVPYITEKFLYSIVTRGLFLAYAQPGWHDHLEKYYGFKRYTKLFDYRFDTIQNPVERLIELVTMVSKFSCLSPAEWHDLYLIEQDTIEYNYDHYFSGNYLTQLKQYE
jgi:hypothetical protein